MQFCLRLPYLPRVPSTFSCHLILSVPSSRVKESNKKAEKKCFLLVIHGRLCSIHRQISQGSSTALVLYSEEGPFESELNLSSLSLSREFLDSWCASKYATTDSFQILKFSYSWSSSHLILQYITSATATSSQSKLKISRHLCFVLSKLLLLPPSILRSPNPQGRDLKLGRQIILWAVNFQNNNRSSVIWMAISTTGVSRAMWSVILGRDKGVWEPAFRLDSLCLSFLPACKSILGSRGVGACFFVLPISDVLQSVTKT